MDLLQQNNTFLILPPSRQRWQERKGEKKVEFSLCYGCMEPSGGYPCPRCGYDPHKRKAQDYALRPGTILNGKYLVGKVLGQGGFGITYIGWDLLLERKGSR